MSGPHCGDAIQESYQSFEKTVIVSFLSDIMDNFPGFELDYECVEGVEQCGGEVYGPSGSIQTPGYPNDYPNNTWCIWNVICGENEQAELEFTDFDLEYQDTCT